MNTNLEADCQNFWSYMVASNFEKFVDETLQ